jgi:hypothetical protein
MALRGTSGPAERRLRAETRKGVLATRAGRRNCRCFVAVTAIEC